MAKQLRLTVDLYDQPRKWGQDRDGATIRRMKGEVFEPVSSEEYDRLIEIGAAEDPAEVQKRAEEELERRRDELAAQRDALDAEIGAVAKSKPESLKGKALDDELVRRGLSTDGTAEEKRARLSEALVTEQQTPPATQPPGP